MDSQDNSILVVDENTDVRRVVSLALISAGYTVSEVNDWAQAMNHLKTRRYDVILTDFRKPYLNEQALESLCRDLCPSTPVIALSSGAVPSCEQDRSTETGDWVFACFSKPIDARLLLYAVRSAIAHRDSSEPPLPPTRDRRAFYWRSGPSGTC